MNHGSGEMVWSLIEDGERVISRIQEGRVDAMV